MKSLAALAAAFGLFAAGSAAAGDARVAYGDLDLTTASGVAAFNARLDAAARRVCRNPEVTGSRIHSTVGSCRAEARGQALEQLSARVRADYALGQGVSRV